MGKGRKARKVLLFSVKRSHLKNLPPQKPWVRKKQQRNNPQNQIKTKQVLLLSHTGIFHEPQPAPSAAQPAFASLLSKLFPKWGQLVGPHLPHCSLREHATTSRL